MQRRAGSDKAIDGLIAALLAQFVLAALLATSRDYAMVFDEAFTVDRDMTLVKWFAALAAPPSGMSRAELFRPDVLEQYWRFSRREPDGHPPFYALIGIAGWRIVRGWVNPLTSYRFGPMVLTAATSGSLYLFLASRYGRLAAATAATTIVLAPRTFAHAHYAHYDMPVTCLWILTQMAFVKSLRSARWVVAFGIVLGLAMGTKLTGWFAVAPAIGWWAIFEGRSIALRLLGHLSFHGPPRAARPPVPLRSGLPATRALSIGIPLAVLTLIAIQPPWWWSPLWGVRRFLVSNLTREQSVPVTSLYLGTVYRFALPWHNTMVLTAVTMPALVVLMGFVGIVATTVRARTNREGLIWPMSWVVLMIVRALPSAPGHDVERLLLPSLVSLSVLSGIGVGWLADWLRSVSPRLAPAGTLIALLAVSECLLGIVQTYPYNLSYYSLAIGGLPGAERLGLEETYYWDTLGPEFLSWARRRSESGPLELSFPLGLLNIMILRDWGDLPEDVKVADLDPTVHPNYVLQRNRGIYAPRDWWLERHGHPIFVIRRQGVDLLRVYPAQEYETAVHLTRDEPGVLRSSQRVR